MKRSSVVALLLALGACVEEDEPELVWNVDVTASEIVVGQATVASSEESLPSGDSPMPLVAIWYVIPEGVVSMSSDIGATITLTGVTPGTATLYASAGGLQGGQSREVEIVVRAP